MALFLNGMLDFSVKGSLDKLCTLDSDLNRIQRAEAPKNSVCGRNTRLWAFLWLSSTLTLGLACPLAPYLQVQRPLADRGFLC